MAYSAVTSLLFLGVCCFPYGELLDQTFEIVKKAKEMIGGKRDVSLAVTCKSLKRTNLLEVMNY